MSDKRDDQRAAKRELPCEVVIPPPLPPREPARPEIPCTPSTPPEVDVFFSPAAAPAPVTPFATIAAVLVGPASMGAACSETSDDPDLSGNDVALDDSETIKRDFLWQTIPGITEAQLFFISRLDDAVRNGIAAVTWNVEGAVTSSPFDAATLADSFRLQLSQAQYVIDTVVALAEDAWAASKARALGRLSCVFWNTEQTAECDVGALEEADGIPLTTFYTVPAEYYSSPGSVEEANTLALIAAQAELTCLWGNAEITRKCSQLPGNNPTQFSNYTALEATQPATEEFLPGLPEHTTRRLSATIAAATVTSAVSQAEADEKAAQLAFEQLSCFFTSAASAACPLDEDSVVAAGGAADVFARIPGNLAEVPAGLTSSTLSQADALGVATAFAEDLLDCYWENRALTYECDDNPAMSVSAHLQGTYVAHTLGNKLGQMLYSSAHGLPIEMLASYDRGVYSMTIDAGECRATLDEGGRAGAETQALILAQTQLNCVYCNPEIPPVCVPTYDAETQTLPLPLDPEDDELSIDATAGIPGVKYAPVSGTLKPVGGIPHATPIIFICTSNANEALAVADTVGVIPVKSNSPQERNNFCRYGNIAMNLNCAGILAAGDPALPSYVLHPSSTSKTISVPAGQFYVFRNEGEDPADAVGRANELARDYARTALNCEFGSPKLIIKCGADESGIAGMTLPTESEYTTGVVDAWVGDGHFGPLSDLVHTSSTGSPANPVIIPQNSFRTSIGWREAVQLAFVRADGLLNCYFRSTVTAECTPHPDTRAVMTDRRSNTAVWGSPTHPTGSLLPGGIGQVALFKYAGPVPVPFETPRPVNIGITVPSASATATSVVSNADAAGQASAQAEGLLDCTHLNWPRSNYRCPRSSDILFQAHIVYAGEETESPSTMTSNIMAEQIARDRTICEECAPFRLATWDTDTDTKVKLCPGSATFWSISFGQGAGSKLLDCSEAAFDGLSLKRVYWGTCGTPLSSMPDTLADGRYLYWLKLTCCPKPLDPDSKEPAIILVREDATYSAADIKEPDFYPDTEMTTKAEDAEAIWVYVGAIVVGISDPEDGRRSAVYQHTDENLQVVGSGGGGTSGPFHRLYKSGGKWKIQGGQVQGSAGNVTVADAEIGDVSSAPADGKIAYLKIGGTGFVSAGRLLGFKVTTAEIFGAEDSLPANTLPNVDGTTVTYCYIQLAAWYNDHPTASSTPGGYSIGYCLPSYTINRI